jgi:hypothetical protein
VGGPEVILDFPRPLEPTWAVRSTLITSSLEALHGLGLFDRYDTLQRSEHRNTILRCVAGQWLSLEVGLAHYTACDALGLSEQQQIDIGKLVSRRIHETFLSVIVKVARGVGVTPWPVLAKGNVMLARLRRGGGIRVTKLSRTSARVEIAEDRLLVIPYARNGLVGIYTAAVELLASNASTHIIKNESQNPGRLVVLHIEWE